MAAFWFWRSQDRGAARWSLRKNRGLLGHCRHVREDGQRGVDAMDGTRSDMGAAGDGVGVVQTHHGRRSAPGMPWASTRAFCAAIHSPYPASNALLHSATKT